MGCPHHGVFGAVDLAASPHQRTLHDTVTSPHFEILDDTTSSPHLEILDTVTSPHLEILVDYYRQGKIDQYTSYSLQIQTR